ncbi:MAG: nucleotidyltransferase family protein [Bryobacterales bacterium]|nr:nucleotidyltransferase family protein [Bryobacterales bacterium]
MLPTAILAGGLATRMRPLTETVPKSLLAVAGRPFIHHQLEQLRENGVREVVLCVGYLGEMVEAEIGDGARYELSVRYSYDGPALRGTAGALHQALPLLPAGSPFFVLYGDSYLPVPFAPIARHFLSTEARALMTVYRNASQFDRSNVVFRENRIVVYDKKHQTADMEHIDYGLGIFRPEAFAQPPESPTWDLAELYQSLLAEDKLAAYEVHTRFYEIGSPQGLAELDRLLTP